MKENIDLFRKLRDTCDGVVKALESDDEQEIEAAMGRFLYLMVQMSALK
ncbi:hypothetical protein PA598K_01352 [Paenibacillus sp. 598K]|nr:hypothetical protein [Paenibacillus sp. 598K]GBF73067.1 hypothetical protein PA598K_01352 [Paenibacillus sp. 598K]